jgi:hypothetical protein
VDVAKTSKDKRTESRRIRADTLQCIGEPLSTHHEWAARRPYLDRLRKFDSFEQLDRARECEGITLGLLVGQKITALDVTPAKKPEWTVDEIAKLSPAQGDLFSEQDRQELGQLQKLPYDFHYRYRPVDRPGCKLQRHKIVDWEAGALYRNVSSRPAGDWETAFRSKYEVELPGRELKLLMGTMHRFPDQWPIVSVIAPPHERNLRLL